MRPDKVDAKEQQNRQQQDGNDFKVVEQVLPLRSKHRQDRQGQKENLCRSEKRHEFLIQEGLPLPQGIARHMRQGEWNDQHQDNAFADGRQRDRLDRAGENEQVDRQQHDLQNQINRQNGRGQGDIPFGNGREHQVPVGTRRHHQHDKPNPQGWMVRKEDRPQSPCYQRRPDKIDKDAGIQELAIFKSVFQVLQGYG